MLQNIRQQVQGTAAKIVVGLIVISFSLFGIESILVGGGGSEVAEVNGESIYPQQLQQAMDTQKRRLIAMMGQNIDPAMLDDERLAPQALEALISRELLMQSANEMGLVVSDPEIGSVVAAMEEFQVDGVFSPEVYKSVLSTAGYTPTYFKESLHIDILLNQLRSGIAGSEFVTTSELAVNAQVVSEQRDFQYFTIRKEKYSAVSDITDTQVDAYYSAHQNDFQTPESVDLEYLELGLDDFREPVEEGALLEAYELAKQDSRFQPQNRISHILIESDDDGEVAQRIALAQEKLQNGIAFAEVAGEFSDDIGSAQKGGDLGYTSGNTFPAPMEAAIAQLEPGVVSAPVKTDAGTHLVLVTERNQGVVPSFDEMRDELRDTIQTEEARVTLLRTVESLKDLSFNAEDLEYPAKELGLPIKRADAVTRTLNEGLFSNPALLEAAFSEDVLLSGNNSEVIELAENRFVVLSVRRHNAPELEPLASVREKVLVAIAEELALKAVANEAGYALKKLYAGAQLAEIAESAGYEIQVELGMNRRDTTVPSEVLQRTFELPQPDSDSASADFVMLPNGDSVVIQLLEIRTGEYESLADPEKSQLEQALNGELGSLIDTEYQRGLRDRADIKVL
jgi:peptidyl-prolyl cis-trans isomerase D